MRFHNEVNQAKTFVEQLAQGKYRITSTTAEGAYNRKTEEEHRKARERKRRAECDDLRVAVGPGVLSECGA